MTSSSVLLILVGLFVVINAPNFVGVFQGNKKFNLDLTPTSAVTTATPGQTPVVNAQTGFVTGTRSVSGG